MAGPLSDRRKAKKAATRSIFWEQFKAVFMFTCGLLTARYVMGMFLKLDKEETPKTVQIIPKAGIFYPSDRSKIYCDRMERFQRRVVDPEPHLLKYVSTPSRLYGRSPLMVVGVMSHPNRTKQRRAIRESYFRTARKSSWEGWLVVGAKDVDPVLMHSVREEQDRFGDIVIFENLEEGPAHRSTKVEVFLQWGYNTWGAWGGENIAKETNKYGNVDVTGVAAHQNHPEYFVKTDDDCAVEIPMLIEALKHKPRTKLYFGRPYQDVLVKRPRAGVRGEGVTEEEFPERRYPLYMGGAGYVLSGDLVKFINEKTIFKEHTPFKYADVNIGMLLNGFDYEPFGNRQFYLGTEKRDTAWEGSTQTFVHDRMDLEEYPKFAMEKKLNPELPWRRHGAAGKGAGRSEDEEFETELEEARKNYKHVKMEDLYGAVKRL